MIPPCRVNRDRYLVDSSNRDSSASQCRGSLFNVIVNANGVAAKAAITATTLSESDGGADGDGDATSGWSNSRKSSSPQL
jgi:hypothetical protein